MMLFFAEKKSCNWLKPFASKDLREGTVENTGSTPLLPGGVINKKRLASRCERPAFFSIFAMLPGSDQ